MDTPSAPQAVSQGAPPAPLAGATAGPSLRERLRRRALQVTVAYAVFATAWIYLSDAALHALVRDPAQLERLSIYKGVFFVVFTSALLLALIRSAYRAVERGYQSVKAREAEIERFNRLYAALSQINHAIVWTADRDEMFRQVCRILVEQGGFKMAWIGWQAEGVPELVGVASHGDTFGYVANIVVSTRDDDSGRGPSGTAFRTGTPNVCNDLLTDPTMLPWRDRALRAGYRSSAAFPIRQQGQVRAVLSVYAQEPAFFRQREQALLTDSALDISFALDGFARAAQLKDALTLAQREQAFSDTVIESMPGILYFYDSAGRFLRWNRNFERASGYSAQEIAGMQPADFFAPEDQAALALRIAEVFERGESSLEAPFLARDGTRTPYFFTGRRVQFEGRDCLAGVGIDISQRVHAEEALRELNATLEMRVLERTAELQTVAQRAEVADRLKSAFLATMSHELRTPLNSIIGFTGILMQGLAGPLNAEQSKQMGMVRNSARHLLDLINDVLDLSKIEAGQLEVRADHFDLPESVERAAASIRPLAARKGLSLQVRVADDLSTMVGDRRRFEQILINLLNNAVKFTERGGVQLSAVRVEDYRPRPDASVQAAVRLSVADTGPGIQPQDLDKLFQPFKQLDTGLARQHEGTGLGLAICRRLTRLMGGEIHASSQWGRGSVFTVTLPLQGRSNT